MDCYRGLHGLSVYEDSAGFGNVVAPMGGMMGLTCHPLAPPRTGHIGRKLIMWLHMQRYDATHHSSHRHMPPNMMQQQRAARQKRQHELLQDLSAARKLQGVYVEVYMRLCVCVCVCMRVGGCV